MGLGYRQCLFIGSIAYPGCWHANPASIRLRQQISDIFGRDFTVVFEQAEPQQRGGSRICQRRERLKFGFKRMAGFIGQEARHVIFAASKFTQYRRNLCQITRCDDPDGISV